MGLISSKMVILPEDYVNGSMSLKDMYNNSFDCKMEVFVNGNNQIVRQLINFKGGIVDEDMDVEITILLDTSYSNIGSDIIIEAPI